LGAGRVDLPAVFAAGRAVGDDGPLTAAVCMEILNGRYAVEIHDAREPDPLLAARDRILPLCGA